MFLTFDKTVAKFGGVRVGVGIQLTKKDMRRLSFLMMVISICKLMWTVAIACGWAIYALFYGVYWVVKWAVKQIICLCKRKASRNATSANGQQERPEK